MKCSVKRGQAMQEQKVIKCCICGKEIPVTEGNNPYPVRDWSAIGTDINRCCHKCNHEIVVPSRLVGRFAKNQKEINNYRLILMTYTHEQLSEIFAKFRV